ncbi:M20 family metallopeptidase [Psychromonas sp.]|uniref:M20 family metallopeptidase n=1 Tax=Psychromonas sp. TaxID=1884585 RepID=UPI003A96D939
METNVVKLTQALLSMDTINPPGAEKKIITYIANWLQDAGFDTEIYSFGENRSNLVAKTPGNFPHYLTFTGHVDTVPLGQKAWKYSPWGEDIEANKLYGRGSSDMKGAIAAFLIALLDFTFCKTDKGIMLIITGGEETGCDGARALLQDVKLPPVSALIVGEPTDNEPVVGHKGALWLRCQTEGVTAHGAMPHLGDNAIYKTAAAIQRIQEFTVGPDHPIMKAPTLNVGCVEGGININSVPDYAHFDVDIRTNPSFSHQDVTERLTKHLGDNVKINRIVDLPAVLTEHTHPWIEKVKGICGKPNTNVNDNIVSYFSDASLLVEALGNPPCIILGPGSPSQAHQTDEYCLVDNLYESICIYKDIIKLAS